MKIFLSVFVFAFVPCLYANSQNSTNIRFPVEKELEYKVIKVDPVIFAETPGVVISANKFIFMRSSFEPLFFVFDIPSFNLTGSFGKRGNGPNEFKIPDSRNAVATENGFNLFDIHKGLIFVDISEFGGDASDVKIEQIKLPGELFMLNDAVLLNDSTIIGLHEYWRSDSMYVSYNLESKKIEYFGQYPDFSKRLEEDAVWGAFWRHSVIKPDGTKIASFFENFKMFRIYDNCGTLEKEVVMNIPEKVFFKKPKESIATFYQLVKSTNKYIYAMCINGYPEKYLELIPEIEVWDWEGKPVAKFKLTNPVFSFDVTDDNNTIYCIDRVEIDKIYMYNLDLN
ncbi:BF3164 family lipoprotein [Maribellus maritimus]|uniref:BF3164 family lipoprotein n=1 Tax=Maribellus maritimus TaxID=2870838 RepID=UPI001EEAC033|nr:BF3164 family lipoprotein [Maribellus maritimus]MCG6186037.1 TolB-like 6-bladed beta-propeller domain-containing protein [Maribellus maritimus]